MRAHSELEYASIIVRNTQILPCDLDQRTKLFARRADLAGRYLSLQLFEIVSAGICYWRFAIELLNGLNYVNNRISFKYMYHPLYDCTHREYSHTPITISHLFKSMYTLRHR